MTDNVYFVSGIDTNIGKSYATGYIARTWNSEGRRTITQKLIQTGNTGMSEDIELHRRLMGCGLLPEDRERLTMPEIFSYPCSPHLAAEIDGRPIDLAGIERATVELSRRYDAVLLEGAGGLMVPLTYRLHRPERISAHLRDIGPTGQHQPFSLRVGSHPRPPYPSAHRSLQPLPAR